MSQVDSIQSPVLVNGSVESETDRTPLQADIVAVLAPGNSTVSGALTSFEVTTSTDLEGRFAIRLLPGNYTITAVPNAGSKYGTRTADWTIAATPSEQAGKLIRIGPSATLTGVVLGESSKEPLASATIAATPSTFGRRPTFLDKLLGHGNQKGVRSQMAVADARGSFQLPVDPGRYDVAVWPADGTGYPWAIRTNQVVDVGVKGLLSIQVGNPVAYNGGVTVSGRGVEAQRVALPGALLRFYAAFDESGQLTEDGSSTVFAVQIGETRANETGFYRLLLPDKLN